MDGEVKGFAVVYYGAMRMRSSWMIWGCLVASVAVSVGQPLAPRVFEGLEPKASSTRAVRAGRVAYRGVLGAASFDARSVEHFEEAKRVGKAVRMRFNVAPGVEYPVEVQSAASWAETGTVAWTGVVDTAIPGSFSVAVTDGMVSGYLATGAGRIFEIGGTVGDAEIVEVDPATFPTVCPAKDAPGGGEEGPVVAKGRERQLPGPASQLDVLVVYSTDAKNAAGGTAGIENQIRESIAYTNQAYANTGLALRVNLVGTREVAYTENGLCGTALDRVTNPADGVMDEVAGVRDQVGADLVSLWVLRGDCGGVAWVMRQNNSSFSRNAYSVTVTQSSTFWRNISFAQELGHNMGSTHDRANSGGQGLFSFSYGYQSVEAQPFFRDIMAYQCAGADCPTQQYFSSPDIRVFGRPIGVADPSPTSADAAETFVRSAPTIEAFRPRGGSGVTVILSPSSLVAAPTGGAGSVNVTATTAWQAVSQASWITGVTPASGNGNGVVNFQVAPNGSGALRRGSVQVGGATLVVEQGFAFACATTPVQLGTAVNGTLTGTGCLSPVRGNTRAARYSFAGVAGQQVAVVLSSTAFDTYLYLLRPDGTVLAEDDDGGGALNSRVPAGSGFVTLPTTGTYTIEATAFDPAASGAFTLTTLTTVGGCTFALNPGSLTEQSARVQRSIAVTTGTGCGWTAVSQASWIGVASGTSGAGSGSVSLDIAANNTASSRSGTVLIGGRTLTVTQAGLTSCPTSPIAIGGSASGTLGAAAGCFSAFRSAGTFAARFAFAGTAGQTVRVELTSPTLDTYLYLIGTDGSVLAEDDDAGGNLNSTVPSSGGVVTLPTTGTYTIEATTFDAGQAGAFTVRVVNPSLGVLVLVPGRVVPLRLEASFTKLLDEPSQMRKVIVPPGTTRLEVRTRITTPQSNLDLYLRRGQPPVLLPGAGLRVEADYRAETNSPDETIVVTNPLPGEYFIAMFTLGLAPYTRETTLSALVTPVPAAVVPSVTETGPLFGSGVNQTVTLKFSHPAGVGELGIVNALINRALDGGNACYIAYSQPQRVLYLVNDAGPAAGLSVPLTLGSTASVSNSQCTIFGTGSSWTTTETELTLRLNISFRSGFGGNRVIYLAGRTVGEDNSGWRTMGVVELPETGTTLPRAELLTPATGTTAGATLSATYGEATSGNNVQTAWMLMNSAVNGARACYVAYSRPGNLLVLVPDNGDGSAALVLPLGGTGSVENSQCRISAQGSSAVVNGNRLTLNLNVLFKPAFAGPVAIFGAVQTNAGGVISTSPWRPLGAWQVPP
jgi:peptidyl-Asp metalloendopeptidase